MGNSIIIIEINIQIFFIKLGLKNHFRIKADIKNVNIVNLSLA